MQATPSTLSALDLAERSAQADVALHMDEDAFRGFYERTSRPVWAYLQRLTGDAHAADDLLQETYYRFLRAEQPLDGEAHQRHYLFRIATNLANDRYRRRQTRPVEVAHDADTVSGRTASLDRQMDVNRAMARLGRRERAMLWLAYVQGASHQEIAGVLGLRASSVKTLLFRARQRMATMLGSQKGRG